MKRPAKRQMEDGKTDIQTECRAGAGGSFQLYFTYLEMTRMGQNEGLSRAGVSFQLYFTYLEMMGGS